MAARKFSLSYRSPRFLGVHRQGSAAEADLKAGELVTLIRAKVRNTPTDRNDLHVLNVRRFYAENKYDWNSRFDSTDKISRLRDRRIARKNVIV